MIGICFYVKNVEYFLEECTPLRVCVETLFEW